jgi:hypothetical protein
MPREPSPVVERHGGVLNKSEAMNILVSHRIHGRDNRIQEDGAMQAFEI